MPNLKLFPLQEATRPRRIRATLQPFCGETVRPIAIDTTRLQAPICYWVVYRCDAKRITLKSFFAQSDFERYAADVAAIYPDQMGNPSHAAGGVIQAPELNAILWAFPFDPAMPHLASCMEDDRVAASLGRPGADLVPEVVNYNPEIRALIAHRESPKGAIVAYGKAAPSDTSRVIFGIMEHLWRSEARTGRSLDYAQPLAFVSELGLLLQAPAPGRPLGSDRNRGSFLELVRHSALAIADVHQADYREGRARSIADLLRRLDAGRTDLSLTAPQIEPSLRKLIEQIRRRLSRSKGTAPVPSHGDFKYDQFLEHQGRYTLIDFEYFCQAEPALDLGTFCAYLPPSSPRDWREGGAAELLRSAFLTAYAEEIGVDPDYERIALYEAAMLATRGLAHVWSQRSGWRGRASPLIDLAFERLVDPRPKPGTDAVQR